ncbi:MAG: alpha-glucosidase/alpha-galactosidase [Clostridia bacterium]|nr:alpha-glucosidase/alpha-galactosidase [Clostridia bacterium]
MALKANDLKIAYIGGGSRGWAWGLMSDLAQAEDMSGKVYLYDIDFEAAKNNEIIGNGIEKGEWEYKAVEKIGEALEGADFVVISILPGTFDEMESDVHTPEEYGIYQSVGDTVGPGGIIRALRTIPMMEEIALAVRDYCPDAWVINYTNPMSLCVAGLYSAFPQIKAFGCCHEVFAVQNILRKALKDIKGIDSDKRDDVKIEVTGINHFTWITKAQYKGMDLFPVYKEFAEKYYETGYNFKLEENHINNYWRHLEQVKFDLFLKYGYIAAAGDRHLAEFCPGDWYLKDPETVQRWGFGLTPVSWRKDDLKNRLAKSARLISGEEKVDLSPTGEEGVKQMRAILGLEDMITNVNLPNRGQISNLPLGAVVETNSIFTSDSVTPVVTGDLPKEIYPLISRVCGNQQLLIEAIKERNLDKAFLAFVNDPLVRLPREKARELFDKMVKNTAHYLTMYNIK